MDFSLRTRKLNDKPVKEGEYVLYWMQAAVRSSYNHALEYAVEEANRAGLPLAVVFCLDASFPEANARHFAFLLQGLAEVRSALSARGIAFTVLNESCTDAVPRLSGRAAAVVTDRGCLRIQRQWRSAAAKASACAMFGVDTETVVPVDTASGKEAFSAATLRPALKKQLGTFLVSLPETEPVSRGRPSLDAEDFEIEPIGAALSALGCDSSVKPISHLKGGCLEAEKVLEEFISGKLQDYAEVQRDPVNIEASLLSPYLHFGHISPVKISLEVIDAGGPDVDRFLDQLIVRRELSFNFVFYNPRYDSYEGLPEWARTSLELHGSDKRWYIYSKEQLENAETHDMYWNAAQKQMTGSGYMHNYMRMYWGKKIIEWSRTPEEAFNTALYLNNKYQLDGRDPNSFAGVAWCFGKHDRPWKEREIFGKIRYMNANGLKRKFDIDEYVLKIGRRDRQ